MTEVKGTERMAPATPHTALQKVNAMTTINGCRSSHVVDDEGNEKNQKGNSSAMAAPTFGMKFRKKVKMPKTKAKSTFMIPKQKPTAAPITALETVFQSRYLCIKCLIPCFFLLVLGLGNKA